MNPDPSLIEISLLYAVMLSPLWAPFLWWEIREIIHEREITRRWAILAERDRLECEAAKRRREGAE